jgi:hypothetical protein
VAVLGPPDSGAGNPIKVTPEDFHNTAGQFITALRQLDDLAKSLSNELNSITGYAGIDDGAKQFNDQYQPAANALLKAFDKAASTLGDVAVGIDLAGLHHWRADAATIPGTPQSEPWTPVSSMYMPMNLTAPSLFGHATIPLPPPFDTQIPMGHSSVLRSTARNLTDAANQVDNIRNGMHQALQRLFSNNSADDLHALEDFWGKIGGNNDTAILTALEHGCTRLGQALSSFADWINQTQDDIVQSILHALEDMSAAGVAGAIIGGIIALATEGAGSETIPLIMDALDEAAGGAGITVRVETAVQAAVDIARVQRLAAVGAGAGAITGLMTAAMSATPSPDPNTPASTQSQSAYDDQVTQDAENLGNEAGQAVDKTALRNIYDKLKPGRYPNYRVVGSDAELRQAYEEMTVGGKEIPSGTYPGTRTELPDGTQVSIREGSRSGGATIDIRWPDGQPKGKIHIDGP